jgi:hypothetical protein
VKINAQKKPNRIPMTVAVAAAVLSVLVNFIYRSPRRTAGIIENRLFQRFAACPYTVFAHL